MKWIFPEEIEIEEGQTGLNVDKVVEVSDENILFLNTNKTQFIMIIKTQKAEKDYAGSHTK